MNKDLLKKLVKEILAEATEADMKKLRRAVILAIFVSDIPSKIKRDLAADANAPDSKVRKRVKVFSDQVAKDESDLAKSSEYQELKQDPEFLKLANNINQIIKIDDKAGLLDMNNIAFTTPEVKPISYSTLLYYAVEKEASILLNYLQSKYKDDFKKVLYKMLPSPGGPAIRITRENLDELSGEEAIKEFDLDYPVEKVDAKLGTNLAFKNYTFPAGYPEDEVKKIILSGKDQNKLEAFNTLISVNPKIKSISGIQNITDIEDIGYILSCIVRHVPPEDIKFYVEEYIPNKNSEDMKKHEENFYKNIQDKYNIAVGFLPGKESNIKILKALIKKNK